MFVVVYNVVIEGGTLSPKDLFMKVWAASLEEARERFFERAFNNMAEAIEAGHDLGVREVAIVDYR